MDARLIRAWMRLGATMRANARETAVKHGLTFPQLHLLRTLAQRGRMTASEIADVLLVTPGNVTGLLDRLERDGLVVRSRSNEDARVTYVRLTENGHAKADALHGTFQELVRAIFAGLTQEERATLAGLLEKAQVEDATRDC